MSTSARSLGSGWAGRGRRLLRRPFVRDVGVLQVAAIASAGVGFLASVALARLLGVEGYGQYALVVSLGTTIGLLRRLGQDHAATPLLATSIARSDAVGARMALSYFVALGVWSTAIVVPAAMLLGPWIAERFYGDPRLGELLRLYLAPAFWVIIPAATTLALQAVRRITWLAWLENGGTALTAAAGVAGAALGGTVAHVLTGQLLISVFVAAAAGAVYGLARQRGPILPSPLELARGVVRPDFPVRKVTRTGLAMALDKNLASLYPLAPVLLLGAASASEDVAHLRIALSYVAIPGLLLSPIARMLMVKLPEVHARTPERLRSFFLSVSGAGGLASLGITLPFVALSPWLIPTLFGSAFAGSVPLVLILAIDSAMLGLGLTAGPMFRTLDRTDLPIRVHVIVLIVGLPLAYGLIQTHGAAAAAFTYVGLMLALRLATNLLCWRLLAR